MSYIHVYSLKKTFKKKTYIKFTFFQVTIKMSICNDTGCGLVLHWKRMASRDCKVHECKNWMEGKCDCPRPFKLFSWTGDLHQLIHWLVTCVQEAWMSVQDSCSSVWSSSNLMFVYLIFWIIKNKIDIFSKKFHLTLTLLTF